MELLIMLFIIAAFCFIAVIVISEIHYVLEEYR